MPGAGALGAIAFLAPAIQELLYHSMGLDPYGLEDEAPWFPEGSSYERALPSGPSRIEPIPFEPGRDFYDLKKGKVLR
jgi:hypothetical protein